MHLHREERAFPPADAYSQTRVAARLHSEKREEGDGGATREDLDRRLDREGTRGTRQQRHQSLSP